MLQVRIDDKLLQTISYEAEEFSAEINGSSGENGIPQSDRESTGCSTGRSCQG